MNLPKKTDFRDVVAEWSRVWTSHAAGSMTPMSDEDKSVVMH